jgi:serine/threonine protein kinase
MVHKDNKELLSIIESEYFKQRYIFCRMIGKGGFGLVIEARLKDDPRASIAVKMIKSGKPGSTLEQYVKRELKVHAAVKHVNIVGFIGVAGV